MKLLSAVQSRELDRLSRDKYGIASYALMTRAGECVAESIARRWPDQIRDGVIVLAGKGNNGGDAMVAARRLSREGASVRVVLLARAAELKGDARRAYDEWAGVGGVTIEAAAESQLAPIGGAGVIIDAIFGIGLNAEIGGIARQAIELINHAGTRVAAVDIASGVNADSGAIMGAAVAADLTVTFGAAKFGHVSYPGAACCGELEVADIGFAPAAFAELGPLGWLIEEQEARDLIRPRKPNTHKGTYGHPLIIAGSSGKAGAAILASRGALRMGAGLVTAAIPESALPIVAAGQPELMTEPMAEMHGHFDADRTIERLAAIAAKVSAFVIGPGIGVSRDTRAIVEWLISNSEPHNHPMVIDADALNVLSQLGPDRLRSRTGATVLTPHPGEMSRLLASSIEEINADRISAARRLAAISGACVLLKGNRSVIANAAGEVCINSSGNPGMGTPGMGDVLSGMLGALMGQGYSPFEALKLGVFLHGYAADRVAASYGPFGYIAGDLIDELPRAIASLLQ
ncbi:MAG: NAD(P)H-hydrate dehydratase [Candidatus Binataceae bacterium]|nr:NAD(P)H-hydrate dehydratase [Candidatus Binataceae bacterium]